MKIDSRVTVVTVVTVGILLVGLVAQPAPGRADPAPPGQNVTKDSPFACDRMALSPAERKRHFEELGPLLLARKTGVRELSDGYELQFPADASTYQLLAEWTFQERRCCPFFDLAVRLDREGGPLWLRLTGRPGTKDFIKADAGPWIAQ